MRKFILTRPTCDPRFITARPPQEQTPNEFYNVPLEIEFFERIATRSNSAGLKVWRLAEKKVCVSFKAYYKEISDSIDPDSGVSYECEDVQIIHSTANYRHREAVKAACIAYVNNHIQEYEADDSEVKFFI